MSYVFVYNTYFQDGHESHAKVVDTLTEAAALIEKLVGYDYGCRTEGRLSELGVEIPFRLEDVFDQPPPPKKGVKCHFEAPKPKRLRKDE